MQVPIGSIGPSLSDRLISIVGRGRLTVSQRKLKEGLMVDGFIPIVSGGDAFGDERHHALFSVNKPAPTVAVEVYFL